MIESDLFVPKSHSEWLARQCPSAELWLQADDGHISVLTAMHPAVEWLSKRVA